MAVTIKNLGQSSPNATTETALYTCPASTTAVCSSIVVCNRGGAATTFRISHAVGGGATQNKDYLYYDTYISANDTFIATIGITVAASDKINVYSGNANLSYNLYGQENT